MTKDDPSGGSLFTRPENDGRHGPGWTPRHNVTAHQATRGEGQETLTQDHHL